MSEEIRVTPEDQSFHHQLLVDDAEVSGLWVVDRQIRVGCSAVRMGGIAGVGTGDQHRNRSYARRVLENSTRWMMENGFDCAMLYGIPDFYHRFGYASCLPNCECEVRTREAERAPATLTVCAFAPEHREAVLEIYAANNANLTGSIVRAEQTDLFRKGTDWSVSVEAVVFTDEAGVVQAYAARDVDRDWMRVGEVGVRDLRYVADVVRWAAECAIAARYEKISFFVPPGSAFGACLAQYGMVEHVRFYRNANGMGRLLNLNSFFAKTLPEWTRRAQTTGTLQSGDSLRLETDIGSVTLLWNGETVESNAVDADEKQAAQCAVALPQFRLMQLAMGYYDAVTALAFPDFRISGATNLMQALFPRRLPYMWVTDHF